MVSPNDARLDGFDLLMLKTWGYVPYWRLYRDGEDVSDDPRAREEFWANGDFYVRVFRKRTATS